MPIKSRSFRRRVPLVVTFAALALALSATQALAALYAYTGNYNDDNVSVIDTATNQIVGNPIPAGEGPYTMAITPNGQTLLVGNTSSEDVTVIGLAAKQVVTTIPVGVEPATIAVTPDGKTAWVTDEGEDRAVAIDLQTNTVSGTPFPVGGTPWGLAITSDGKTAYVTNDEADTVTVLDVASRQITGTIPVGDDPINIVLSPDGKTAYVSNYEGGTVTVIDTATRSVVGGPIPTGSGPWGLGLTPNGSRLYVANYTDATVSVIDTASRSVVGGPIPTGEQPYEIAVTPNGKTAYVANYAGEGEGKGVTAINTATNLGTDINVTGGPWQVVVAPDQSPVPAFTAKASKKNPLQVSFSGLGSTDPDGSIAYNWDFGDGKTALNGSPTPKHTYVKAGKYTASLAPIDDEGCSVGYVSTGRTAYCSGSAPAAQLITVKAPNNFKFGKLVRNTKTGTAKLKVKVPYAGKLTLSGKAVKKSKGSAKNKGTVTLRIKPKPKAKKLLATGGSAKVKIKVTFKPKGGKAKTKGRSVKLLQK